MGVKPLPVVLKMESAFVKLPGGPAVSHWASEHENICLTLLTSFWLSVAVVAIYLTTVVHPAFLPLLLLAVFVLCHVLVNPKAAKSGQFGTPVIKFTMPEEMMHTLKIMQPQPTYKTMAKEKVPEKVRMPDPVPCAKAYCNLQPSFPSLHAPAILVV